MNQRDRLGDRRGRDGRDGRDGVDGKDGQRGEPGKRGEPGLKGDPGTAGRDAVFVPADALFDRDEFTHQTLQVRVIERGGVLLTTITPAYDDDGFIESAQIIPA